MCIHKNTLFLKQLEKKQIFSLNQEFQIKIKKVLTVGKKQREKIRGGEKKRRGQKTKTSKENSKVLQNLQFKERKILTSDS